MVTKKEDTAKRISRRKYEESHKDERREKCGNFQTMIPRKEYEEINAFLKTHRMTKVQFIKEAFEILKTKYDN